MFATSLTVNVEAEYLWLVQVHLGRDNDCVWVVLQEHMREACSKIGSIDVDASELWQVHLFAARAVHLEARGLQVVTEANGEHFLLVAKGARAETIDTREILLVNLGQATRGNYVTTVDQTVQV